MFAVTLCESAIAEVRRSSSATSPEAVFGRRPASAHRLCVTMARIMSRCDMAACCKFGRRSNGAAEIIPCCNARTVERAPLQAAQLREALPVAQTTVHAIGQLRTSRSLLDASCDVYETKHTVRRPRLLRENCVMKKASRMHPQKVNPKSH